MTSTTVLKILKLLTWIFHLAVPATSIAGVVVPLDTYRPGALSTVSALLALRTPSSEVSCGVLMTTRLFNDVLGATVNGTNALNVMSGIGVFGVTPFNVQVMVVPPASDTTLSGALNTPLKRAVLSTNSSGAGNLSTTVTKVGGSPSTGLCREGVSV